ncbi:membrane protein FAM174B isoform X1 [Zalophus californianus]|uniref:Membrane protein FAM174B isoform X1 n=2 Tax=Zalophus californianus TaxID=9704 RepID=A0A6J2B6S1_ZALCA|nr:membrane protein FAM174B isoform X1 [Zalophus californianus]
MRAARPLAPLLPLLLLLALLAAPAARARRAESAPARQPEPERRPRPLPGPGPGNATRTGSAAPVGGGGSSNSSGDALVTRISSLLRDLPTLKAAVIVACAFTALLIACLLLRVFRSGKRLKKTRKYDIITTPAERVEMAPLNEDDDDDEDSTVFDIKYRCGPALPLPSTGDSWARVVTQWDRPPGTWAPSKPLELESCVWGESSVLPPFTSIPGPPAGCFLLGLADTARRQE